jgi:AraC family transcriptional regulator of adaptative response / DNA-3-methyladenine glycosylase II
VLLAKALIHQTDLSMAQVALGSGFGSVRRFNETFQALYGRPPSALRRRGERIHDGGVRLSLSYRPPYDWDAMFTALTARGDTIEGRRWSRTLTRGVDGADGSVSVEPAETGRASVCVEVDDLKALPGVLARVRRVFDLSADPDAIGRDLSTDPVLKPLVAARPGLRLPGLWIDERAEAPNDRLDDETLSRRAEAWRPWRAYGALHLALAGISGADLERMEKDDAKRAA